MKEVVEELKECDKKTPHCPLAAKAHVLLHFFHSPPASFAPTRTSFIAHLPSTCSPGFSSTFLCLSHSAAIFPLFCYADSLSLRLTHIYIPVHACLVFVSATIAWQAPCCIDNILHGYIMSLYVIDSSYYIKSCYLHVISPHTWKACTKSILGSKNLCAAASCVMTGQGEKSLESPSGDL